MLKFKNGCVNMKKKFNRIAVLANALEENDIRKWLKQRNPFNHVTVAFDRK